MSEQHTGANIATIFEQVLLEFGIQLHEFGCQITDNTSNMIKTFELFSLHANASLQVYEDRQNFMEHESYKDNDNNDNDYEVQRR